MLSIVIPTLNEAQYLPALLQSIKEQNYPCQIIIADAGSTDQTVTIAKQNGCQVIKGGNPSFGRNQGASLAESDLILFLDADTILPPGFLQANATEFYQRKLAVAAGQGLPLSKHPVDWCAFTFANWFIVLLQAIRPFANGFCILIKKELHDKINGFDQSISFAEDSEYVDRAAKQGKFGVLGKKILVSPRRFVKEGRFKLIGKYIVLNLRRMLWGEIRQPIDYQYGKF